MHYTSDRPCRKGHLLRYTRSDRCVICERANAAVQNAKSKGKARVRDPAERARASRRYWLKNRSRYCAWVRARRARLRGAPGMHTPEQVVELLHRQRGLCVYCRASLDDGFEEDHIEPIAKGGSNDITNIQLLCVSCNRRKGARDPIVFAQRNGLLL